MPAVPPVSRSFVRRPLAVLVLFLAATGVWAGCALHSPGPPQAASVPEPQPSPYVGSKACEECHAETFRKQSASHHALTLRAMAAEWAAGKFTPNVKLHDPALKTEYRVEERNGEFWQVALKGGKEIGVTRFDYLLGSGHHGVSPMSFDGTTWNYMALTYYANHGWDFSPMHGVGDDAARRKNIHGVPVTPAELEKCFRCHSTQLEFNGQNLNLQRSELGVRCESCHGPGRAHVEAARNKAADLAINNPRKWSSESFMALCQQCHNETATLEGTLMGIPTEPNSTKAVKYHVYGVEQSACFRKSQGAFRCTTCHDPHGNTETDPKYYEQRCLSCHAAGVEKQKACPVNSRADCLTCHMPKVQVEKYTKFADHWIRARSPFMRGHAAPKTALGKAVHDAIASGRIGE
jgi:hypothetical protein